MKLSTVLLPLVFCIALTACGGGGGGGDGEGGDRGGSSPASLQFAEDTMFVPIADARIDHLIANFSSLQSSQPDDDLTGTWLHFVVEAGADQTVDKDPANREAPLAVSSYIETSVAVISMEEHNDTITVFQCGAGGWEEGKEESYQIIRSIGNGVTLQEIDTAFNHVFEATVQNNKTLRLSGINRRGTYHTEDPRELHYFTYASAEGYVKLSAEMNAVMGAYTDSLRDGDPVACIFLSQYETMTGMNPDIGSRTYFGGGGMLIRYVDGLVVSDMPTEDFNWPETLPGAFRLQQGDRVGELQVLVE